jgi:hypothetical protein
MNEVDMRICRLLSEIREQVRKGGGEAQKRSQQDLRYKTVFAYNLSLSKGQLPKARPDLKGDTVRKWNNFNQIQIKAASHCEQIKLMLDKTSRQSSKN